MVLSGVSRLRAQQGPQLVRLAPIVQREVADGQTFVGTVMPSRRAIVGSAVDGRVVEFPINEGDRVSEGQTLAQLLTETINLEREAAEAELELRKQELAELQNGSRPDEIEQARARMESAKASYDFREAQKKRVVALFQQGRAATDQQVEEAVSLALEAAENYAEAKAAHQLMVDGPRPERILQAQSRVTMQTAIVEKLKDQIKKHTMISRFAGYVVAEHSEIGQWVSRGDPVAEVVALDEVDIEAKVVESQVPYVRLGETVRVAVPSLPHHAFTGQIVSIVPQADVRSRTFPVKVRVQNIMDDAGQPILKAGMLAQVMLPTGARREALLVPKDSLVLGGPQPVVWTVHAGQARPQEGSALLVAEATAVPVELGVADGELIQVRGNLSANVSVVVMGNERIPPARPGQPAMVQWQPMPGAEGAGHGAD